MKEIVIISGKGGTGKTSIMTSLGYLAGKTAVIADCDVDAADVHLLFNPEVLQSEEFYSGEYAVINQDPCIKCGRCKAICRFDAIPFENNEYTVKKINCEGCGYCEHVCPVGAIEMLPQKAGDWYISKTRIDTTLVHAKLGIGAENSGKLVAKVKDEAKKVAIDEKCDYIIVDGSPGIGCPVVSSITGADFVVFVTEPTVSGIHDLERVHKVVQKFKIKSACIINKADINIEKTEEIKEFLKKEDITLLAELPYDEAFTKAILEGKTVVEYADNTNIDKRLIKDKLVQSWEKIKKLTESNKLNNNSIKIRIN